jgi:cytochrome c-type biogenesis protein CcmH/NrfF
MKRLKASFLVALAATLCLAQTATEYEGPEVMKVAGKLSCNCSCKQNMACQMQPACGVCKTARLKILAMQQAGKSEPEILNSFVAEMGSDVLVKPPGAMGVIGPYVALALGLGLVILVIRRYMRPKPAVAGAPAADPADALLDRYHDQIEKDLEKLD